MGGGGHTYIFFIHNSFFTNYLLLETQKFVATKWLQLSPTVWKPKICKHCHNFNKYAKQLFLPGLKHNVLINIIVTSRKPGLWVNFKFGTCSNKHV